MKIADVRARVIEAALNHTGTDIDRALVSLVVNLTVDAVGFHVAADGDLRPAAEEGRDLDASVAGKLAPQATVS